MITQGVGHSAAIDVRSIECEIALVQDQPRPTKKGCSEEYAIQPVDYLLPRRGPLTLRAHIVNNSENIDNAVEP
jgi:hypothetical protein